MTEVSREKFRNRGPSKLPEGVLCEACRKPIRYGQVAAKVLASDPSGRQFNRMYHAKCAPPVNEPPAKSIPSAKQPSTRGLSSLLP